MKAMVKYFRHMVQCKKGESLVESVVSIFVFTILLTGITALIAAALRMTTNATISYRELQTSMVSANSAAYTASSSAIITFESNLIVGGTPYNINSSQTVMKNDDSDIVSFVPR